ncbi:MAG: hypothetical protein KAH20_01550 [Methylococcales bacterium]|nr:hypothetical protein [Methylococcales bacterium]
MKQSPKKIIPLIVLSIIAFSTHAGSLLEDWTWNVGASITKDNNGTTLNTYYYDNIPSNIKNFQLFIDSIPNKGFNGSDGWEVFGADYLIENTSLYSSQSDTQWKWKYLGEVSLIDNQEAGDKRAIFIHDNILLANAIEGDSVDLYIESYDKDWVGEYSTIPLLDVKVTTDNSNSNNINEAYMKKYVKKQYQHAGVVGLSEYSEYFKIAAVSVSYHSPSYIDIYNFQDSDTPKKVRIDMNEDYLVDFESISIIGQLGHESIVFRMSSRGVNPTTVSLVHYNLNERKVESNILISGGAKEILKERLGENFVGFELTPNTQNAIVTTRDELGRGTYSLYDVSDTFNPILIHHLVTEESRGDIRWFRIINDTIAEYAVFVAGRRVDVRYDYIQNEEVSVLQ